MRSVVGVTGRTSKGECTVEGSPSETLRCGPAPRGASMFVQAAVRGAVDWGLHGCGLPPDQVLVRARVQQSGARGVPRLWCASGCGCLGRGTCLLGRSGGVGERCAAGASHDSADAARVRDHRAAWCGHQPQRQQRVDGQVKGEQRPRPSIEWSPLERGRYGCYGDRRPDGWPFRGTWWCHIRLRRGCGRDLAHGYGRSRAAPRRPWCRHCGVGLAGRASPYGATCLCLLDRGPADARGRWSGAGAHAVRLGKGAAGRSATGGSGCRLVPGSVGAGE